MTRLSDLEDEEEVNEPNHSGDEDDNALLPEDEEAIEENSLTLDMVAESLSLLCKTGNGLAHAYVRLDICQRDVSDIKVLKDFIHLRYIDISSNKLRDISPLNKLTNMLTLKADKNLLRSAKLNEMPYLQHLDFAENKIKDMSDISHHLLEKLNLNGNEISVIKELDPSTLCSLSVLELRGNRLTTTAGITLPCLKKLYLAENQLTKIENLSRMSQLTTLHLRKNKITNLDGFSEHMCNLQYLNLRLNEISELSELQKLECLPKLTALVLKENPVCYEESYRIEVLVLLRRLERLDQDAYDEDERNEAEKICTQRNELKEAEEEEGEGTIEVIQSDEENVS